MSDYGYTASFPIDDDLPVHESPLKDAKKVWIGEELIYDEGNRMIAYDDIQPGYYAWRRNDGEDWQPVQVVEDGAGLHIRTFSGVYSECVEYGEFLHRIEL